jgi:hypothetical protein
MIPEFTKYGLLPAGQHAATYAELERRFGFNKYRMELLSGMKLAILNLKEAGCVKVYIDGSFVTDKEYPSDYDALWNPGGVDQDKIDDVFWDSSEGYQMQKDKFRGEWKIALQKAKGKTFYLDYFQRDKESGKTKGIIVLNLKDLLL